MKHAESFAIGLMISIVLATVVAAFVMHPAFPVPSIFAPGPTVIVVDNQRWPVYYSATYPIDFASEAAPDERIFGQTYCPDSQDTRQFIQVDPNESLEDLQDTVFHEAHHAANNCTYTDEMHTDEWDAGLYDEIIPQEIKLLKQNPGLVEFLLRKR